MNSHFSIPFNASAQAAYDRVAGTAILDPGLKALVEIASSDQPFARRLAEVSNRRIEVVEMYQNEAANGGDPILESQFAYAADDVLEAMFMAEIGRLEASGSASQATIDELANALERQELDPMWNDHVKPRIRAHLERINPTK